MIGFPETCWCSFLQVSDVEKKGEDLENLEEEYEKRQFEITKCTNEIARLKEEADAILVEQTQTQAPDHSSELAALRLQKRDAQTTVCMKDP